MYFTGQKLKNMVLTSNDLFPARQTFLRSSTGPETKRSERKIVARCYEVFHERKSLTKDRSV